MKYDSEGNEYSKKQERDHVGACLTRVNDAMKWRQDANYDDKWARIVKMYANQYDYDELSGYDDIIAPNMMFSTANVIIPSVMVNYPKITVTARNQEDDLNARIVEAVSNYYWQRFDFHAEMKLIVKDFVFFGLGVAKATWLLKEEDRELTREEWVTQVQDALMEAQQARMNPEVASLGMVFPTEDEIISGIPSTGTFAVEDRPNVERISPFDIYIDPDATRFENARWVAQRMYMPLEEAKERDDWSAAARKRLKGAAMSSAKKDYDLMFEGEQRGKEADFAVIWEYYDIVENEVCTFAEGCEMFLSPPADIPYTFGHPFVFILNHIVPEKLYPMGDLESILPLQMELALTRTQMVNDRKRFRRMYMYKPDEIGPDGLAAITSADDNAMIPVDYDGPLSDVLMPVATTPLPPEFYNQTAMILDDIDRTTAVTEYQRGGRSEISRTATEASMIQDMSNARSADKLATVERAISEIAQRCVQLTQEFLTTEQVAKVVGEEGAASWVPYSREDVQGEFDFIVEAGSTQPQNDTFRRQSAMQMLDAMAPFIGAGVVNAAKLAEHVLRMGFGVKNPQDFIVQQQPMAPQGQPGMPPGGPGMPPGAPQQLPPGMGETGMVAGAEAGMLPPMAQ